MMMMMMMMMMWALMSLAKCTSCFVLAGSPPLSHRCSGGGWRSLRPLRVEALAAASLAIPIDGPGMAARLSSLRYRL